MMYLTAITASVPEKKMRKEMGKGGLKSKFIYYQKEF